MVGVEIRAGVGDLDDHLLTSGGTAVEVEKNTRAAEVRLAGTNHGGGSKAVGKSRVDSERLLVGAHVRITTVATRLGVDVSSSDTIGKTSLNRGVDIGLAAPRARRLAAVPVTGGVTSTGAATRNGSERDSTAAGDGSGVAIRRRGNRSQLGGGRGGLLGGGSNRQSRLSRRGSVAVGNCGFGVCASISHAGDALRIPLILCRAGVARFAAGGASPAVATALTVSG